MLRVGSRPSQAPFLGSSSDVAWLEEGPGSLADLNLNSYELDLLVNELPDLNMERSRSGTSASGTGQGASVNSAEKSASGVHRKLSWGEGRPHPEQGSVGRGLLAANARRFGFLEEEKRAKGPFKLSNICIGLLGSSIEDLMDDVEVLGEILPQSSKVRELL